MSQRESIFLCEKVFSKIVIKLITLEAKTTFYYDVLKFLLDVSSFLLGAKKCHIKDVKLVSIVAI